MHPRTKSNIKTHLSIGAGIALVSQTHGDARQVEIKIELRGIQPIIYNICTQDQLLNSRPRLPTVFTILSGSSFLFSKSKTSLLSAPCTRTALPYTLPSSQRNDRLPFISTNNHNFPFELLQRPRMVGRVIPKFHPQD
jgi:hypothetical protein